MASLLDFVRVDYATFIGTRIGSVTLLRELGRGNKGVVFIGFQETLKRNVAVKLLPKVTIRGKNEESMFQTEAEIVASLSHPCIIPIFEIGETEEFYYQIMPLIAGSDLDTVIQKRLKHPIPSKRGMPLVDCFSIITQVLDALEYAHEDQIVHRDIKPANILMEQRTSRPYVADFGIAQTAQAEADHCKGLVVGSPVYLAPEQARGEVVDGRADIYAAGMTLIKMIIGEVPRRRESPEEIIRRKIIDPASFLPNTLCRFSDRIDEELNRIILKSTAPALDQRYQTAEQFKFTLERYQRLNRSIFTVEE